VLFAIWAVVFGIQYSCSWGHSAFPGSSERGKPLSYRSARNNPKYSHRMA
jgi:hypothetical protein